VVTGVLLGLALLLGGKAWFSYQQNQTLSASNIYAQMMAASSADAREKVQAAANELISNYSRSGYAPLAALLLAEQAVDSGELAAAQAQLQWALEHAKSAEVAHIARMRLIRVVIAQQQYAEADKLLAAVADPGAYAYLYSELKGDLAQAQGQRSAAAAAYKLALEQMPPQAPNQSLLTAKYESVGGAGKTSQ
jgi:predicted negative regulator of RcsB-dependent stress response